MYEVAVFDKSGKKSSEVKVEFEGSINLTLMKQVVLSYVTNSKKRTASTKTRHELEYSGQKPWRQKGTGRARAGSRGSPIWRGGGVVFGPHPRDVYRRIPKRMKKAALKQSLAGKMDSSEVFVVNDFSIDAPKTKEIHALLVNMGLIGASILLVTDKDTVLKSARNIPKVEVKSWKNINAYDLLRRRYMVISREDFDSLIEKAKN